MKRVQTLLLVIIVIVSVATLAIIATVSTVPSVLASSPMQAATTRTPPYVDVPQQAQMGDHLLDNSELFNPPVAITPSGLLLPLDDQRIATFYAALPATIGSVQVITYDQGFPTHALAFVVQNINSTPYTVQLYFYDNPGAAYNDFLVAVKGMPTGHAITIGDKAFVDANSTRHFVAAMHYRNVAVTIENPIVRSRELVLDLSDEQLTVVLDAIYKLLQQNLMNQVLPSGITIPTNTPIP